MDHIKGEKGLKTPLLKMVTNAHQQRDILSVVMVTFLVPSVLKMVARVLKQNRK